MASAGSIAFQLRLESAAFRQEMKRASDTLTKENAKMRRSMREVSKASRNVQRQFGQLRNAAVALAGALAIRQFATFTRGALSSAAAMADMSRTIGTSASALQELRFAAEQSGVSVQDLETSLRALSRRQGEALRGNKTFMEGFQQLGITVQELRRLQPEELVRRVADGVQRLGSQAQRIAALDAVMSETGRRLVTVFQGGRESLDAFAESARAAGVVMTDEVVRKGKLADDALTTLSRAFRTTFDTAIIQSFAGSLTVTQDAINAVQRTATEFGNAVGATMRGLAEAAKVVAANMREIAAALAALVAFKAATVIGGIVVALGDLALKAIRAQSAMAGLNVVMRANPIGLVATAIAAAAGALVTFGINTGKATAAEREFARVQREVANLADGATVATQEQAKARLDHAVAVRRETKALLDQQVAFLEERRQRLAESGIGSTARGSALAATNQKIVDRITALREAAADADAEIGSLLRQIDKLGTSAATTTAGGMSGTTDALAEWGRLARELHVEFGDLVKEQDKAADSARDLVETVDPMAQIFEDTATSIRSTFRDTIRAGLDGTIEDIGDFGRRAKSVLFDIIADLATQALTRPVIVPIVTAVGGALGVGGQAQAATLSQLGVPGGGRGGGFGDLFGVGSALSGLGGITGAINSLGGGLGLATGALAAPGITTGAPTAAQFLSSNTGLLGGTTLSSLLGGAGLGFGAGSLLNSLIGGNQTGGMIGSGLGGLAGAAIGSIIPGVGTILGGLIGGAGGGFLGGLFGNNRPSVGPVAGFSIERRDGRAVLGAGGADNAGNLGAVRPFAQGVVDAINRLADSLGAESFAFGGLQATSGRGALRVRTGGVDLAAGSDPQAVVEQALAVMLRRGAFTGLGDAAQTALRNTQATDLQGILSDVQFAQGLAGISFEQEDLTEAERALRAINDRFDEMADRAKSLGLGLDLLEEARERSITSLVEGFDETNRQVVLRLTDPLKAALEEFDKAAEARVREAEKLGADLVLLERRNALERQRVIEQVTQQTTGGLARFLEELTFGGISGASPQANLTGLRATFQATAAQALAGDFGARGRIEDLGRSLLERSRGVFASGQGFQSDLELVRDVVAQIVPDNANSPVVEAVNSSAVENARLMSELIEVNASQDTEIRALRADVQRLTRALEQQQAAA